MPLVLPGTILLKPVEVGLDSVLSGARVTDYRFTLLDRDESPLGVLETVQPGGSLDWDVRASIKGSGRITVSDLGTAHGVDWLNVRIHPEVTLSLAGGGDDPEGAVVGLGIWLASAPVEHWDATGRTWAVELLDKCSLLDQDIYSSPTTGRAVTYTAPAATNIIDAVKAIITGAGELADAIDSSTKALVKPMTWDVGTTRLKIINDLLDAGDFLSLWVDGQGQFQVTPYTAPIDRPPSYEALNPLAEGPSSLMAPEWSRDRDYYNVPNRYVVQTPGNGDVAGTISQAINDDPASPFSFTNRGRWITQVETDVEAADAAALEAYAARKLAAMQTVTAALSVSHMFLPDLILNTTIRFTHPESGIDAIFVVTKTSVPFDPVELCTSTIEEATAAPITETPSLGEVL